MTRSPRYLAAFAATFIAVSAPVTFLWHAGRAAPTPTLSVRPIIRAIPHQSGTPGVKFSAAIIPAGTFALGTSLSTGPDGRNYGDSMTANGIVDDWNCRAGCTNLNFAVWVYASGPVKADVGFKILFCGPTGNAKSCSTSYSYSFGLSSLGTLGSGFSLEPRNAKYPATGVYYAEVSVNNQLASYIPVNITV